MQSVDEQKRNPKRPKSLSFKMPVTDLNDVQNLDDSILFPVEEIVQYPLPGYSSDGGLDESNISPEEKLRRERLRERGLGVTRYEWVKTSSKEKQSWCHCLLGFVPLSC
ncbi:putative dipeptidyl peptidase 8 [Sesbania bispinosa]|nr:putative dipeptidyl peptidase 8 [Sesbania bispinosa]